MTRGVKPTPAIVRFYYHVVPGPGKCKLWTASLGSKGYGQFSPVKGKTYRAHVWIWEYHNGPVPEGFQLCHECDTPSCVSLECLSLGTAAENSADMVAKGRSAAGERHPNSKLTFEDVNLIRASTMRNVDLATKFGVTQATICDIRKGRTWQ